MWYNRGVTLIMPKSHFGRNYFIVWEMLHDTWSWSEEVRKSKFALDVSAVLVVAKAIGGDDGQMDGLPDAAS